MVSVLANQEISALAFGISRISRRTVLATTILQPAEKTLVANLVGSENRGLAFGWFNFAIGIAALPSSLLFGLLYETLGPLVVFGSGALLALVAVGILTGVKQQIGKS